MGQAYTRGQSGAGIRALRLLAVISFVAGISVFAGSIAWYFFGSESEPPADEPFEEIPLPTATSTPQATSTAAPTSTPAPYDGQIARFVIPKYEVSAEIEVIGIVDKGQGRQLDDPHDPYKVGWYGIEDLTEKPGFGGNAVFAAHVDYYPRVIGPFHDIKDLEGGDSIVIVMDDGREYAYEVVAKRRYDKDEIPMGDILDGTAPDLIQPEGVEWITMITCGGSFVPYTPGGAGYYEHRDVVIAQRVDDAAVAVAR